MFLLDLQVVLWMFSEAVWCFDLECPTRKKTHTFYLSKYINKYYLNLLQSGQPLHELLVSPMILILLNLFSKSCSSVFFWIKVFSHCNTISAKIADKSHCTNTMIKKKTLKQTCKHKHLQNTSELLKLFTLLKHIFYKVHLFLFSHVTWYQLLAYPCFHKFLWVHLKK